MSEIMEALRAAFPRPYRKILYNTRHGQRYCVLGALAMAIDGEHFNPKIMSHRFPMDSTMWKMEQILGLRSGSLMSVAKHNDRGNFEKAWEKLAYILEELEWQK